MRSFSTFFLAALLAAAADPGWMTKRVPQWNADDLKQILTSSPWAKLVTPQVAPPLGEYHPPEGGNARGATGVGVPVAPGGVTLASGGSAAEEPVATASNGRGRVMVRWESALPIRAAEMKSRVTGVPEWDGERYAIAVYDVPFVPQSKQQKAALADIKRVTVLKRDGKKDLRAASVEVFPHAGGQATFLYLFPRAEEITAADKNVTFLTQINDLAISHTFDLSQMVFESRLEL